MKKQWRFPGRDGTASPSLCILLGKWKISVQIAGITGSPDMNLSKRALVAMCADNGVVEEGVTQTGQEVTAIVAENFLSGATSACTMCRQCRNRCVSGRCRNG